LLYDQYLEIECKCCHTDLLKKIYEDTFTGLIAFIYDYKTEEINGIETEFDILKIYIELVKEFVMRKSSMD
jgi:hypothetical protein